VWSSVNSDKIPAETNLKPVGSGPFLLDKFDQTQVNLKRNDNYWEQDRLWYTTNDNHQSPDL
jgi:peptide/nickel transport system substrate-binding protein